ncbi:MAG: flagellar basal body L-ring protein FlgH [Planctomycetes bacterium]|nr:flagellar basal body L-ring protein FlgH [Planctomycetota bacterium]
MRHCALALALLAVPGPVSAQSLWNRQADPDASPYDDRPPEVKKYRAQDHIIIIVDESTDAKNTTSTKTVKESSYKAKLSEFLRLTKTLNLTNAAEDAPGFDLESGREQTGSGTMTKRKGFKVDITATVVDVLPNGFLVLEASKEVIIDEDEERITLTGVVNPAHVDPKTDTVNSEKVSHLKVKTEETGPIADANKRGFFAKLFDRFWPF